MQRKKNQGSLLRRKLQLPLHRSVWIGKIMPELSQEIAEKIYNWMNNLSSPDGNWVVDSHEFLPANVTVDWAGRCQFINGMAKLIEKGMDRT